MVRMIKPLTLVETLEHSRLGTRSKRLVDKHHIVRLAKRPCDNTQSVHRQCGCEMNRHRLKTN